MRSLLRLGTVAIAPHRWLMGAAWASRYVLLCEWWESKFNSAKLTMNVSIKTSCFRSKTHPESNCRQSRPDRRSSASRGRGYVQACYCRWVNFESFAKACHGKFFYSGFLLFLEQQQPHKNYRLTKKSGAYHTSFNHQRIDKKPASNAKMYVNQMVWRDNANLKAHISSLALSARNTVRGRFFRTTIFNYFPLEDFSQTKRNRLVGAPRAHFRLKPQNRQIAQTSPLSSMVVKV